MKNSDVTILVEDCVLPTVEQSDVWGDLEKAKRWTLDNANGCVCVVRAFNCEFYGHA